MKKKIREMVGRCDMCAVDLDQCIYPRFTQTTLGALLLLRSLKGKYRKYFPQLLSGAIYISWTRSLQVVGRRPGNYSLMSAFCRVVSGLPLKLVEERARCLPDMGPQSWRVALAELSSRLSVYLLTFSIEPVARAYGEARNVPGERIFRDWRGTSLILEKGKIKGCDITPDALGPEAKLRALEEILRTGDFQRPLIIGHGEDEMLMARRAREMGGSSIGLARGRKEVKDFELVLHGNAWRKIAAALRE